MNLSPEALATTLAAQIKDDDHWEANSVFECLTGVKLEFLQAVVRKWWGKPDVWYNILATEICKLAGLSCPLSSQLDRDWEQRVDGWLAATYTEAAAQTNTPPTRASLQTQAKALYHKGKSLKVDFVKLPERRQAAECEQCGKEYAASLGKCPTCFPKEEKKQENKPEKLSPEMLQLEWRKYRTAALDNVAWSDVSDILGCHGGSGGVLLARLGETEVLCLKKCSAGEYLANSLAEEFGLCAPRARYLEPHCAELVDLRRALGLVRATRDPADNIFLYKVTDARDDRMCAVYQFVDGVSMMGQVANDILTADDGAQSAPIWRELGRIMAFDMLINNFDRLPLVWGNEGNLGNVMLGSSLGKAVAIDQSVHVITHPDGLARYLQKVREGAAEIRAALRDPAEAGAGSGMARVQETIFVNTGVTLSSEQICEVRQGCADFMGETSKLLASGELELTLTRVAEAAPEALRHSMGEAWKPMILQAAAAMEA